MFCGISNLITVGNNFALQLAFQVLGSAELLPLLGSRIMFSLKEIDGHPVSDTGFGASVGDSFPVWAHVGEPECSG